MLLLDRPLPGRFDGVEVRPVLENDVRRDEGAEPPPVAPVLLVGEAARSGDITGGLVVLPRSSAGISAAAIVNFAMPALWRWRLTTLNRVRLGVISHVWCLRLGDLHLAILLSLGQSEVFLIPLQTT